jgi:hypothetical protein
VFRRKLLDHLVPIRPENASKKDWVIVLEAGTIIGPSPEKLRVASATVERKVVKRFTSLFKSGRFLVLEGYDPRIHSVYFCPQLYRHDPDKKLVPLSGEEIGELIARALEGGVRQRRPWFEPSEKIPDVPIIAASMETEFDSVVVEMPEAKTRTKEKTAAGRVAVGS